MEALYMASINQAISLGGAGLAMSFCNPFDLVRFRMQTMPQLLRQGSLVQSYTSIFDCIKRVLKEEGFRALWKGNLSNLLRFYPSQTINFAMKETLQRNISKNKSYEKIPSFVVNGASGLLGGWLTLLVLYPFDYSRLKMANDISGKNGGIIQCLKTTIKLEGITGIYRGAMISFVGVGIFRGAYFGIFDSFKNQMKNNWQKWIVGYFATLAAIFLTYPSDTIRRRMMMTSCQNYKYSGFIGCCKQIYKKEGIKSYYRGGMIMFFQSAVGATVLFLYDKTAHDLRAMALID